MVDDAEVAVLVTQLKTINVAGAHYLSPKVIEAIAGKAAEIITSLRSELESLRSGKPTEEMILEAAAASMYERYTGRPWSAVHGESWVRRERLADARAALTAALAPKPLPTPEEER